MTNLKVRHLNGEVVELNLEKDKIYVDDQNKIVYFKFGDDENGVMQYKELGFKDVCTTPQSIVTHLFNNGFYAVVTGVEQSDDGSDLVHFSRKKYLQEQIDCIKVDDVYNCNIKSIAPFALFAELADGVICMVHCSEASKSSIRDMNTCFKVGDNIKVKIISKIFQDGKWKINASRKQADKGISPIVGTILPVMLDMMHIIVKLRLLKKEFFMFLLQKNLMWAIKLMDILSRALMMVLFLESIK